VKHRNKAKKNGQEGGRGTAQVKELFGWVSGKVRKIVGHRKLVALSKKKKMKGKPKLTVCLWGEQKNGIPKEPNSPKNASKRNAYPRKK